MFFQKQKACGSCILVLCLNEFTYCITQCFLLQNVSIYKYYISFPFVYFLFFFCDCAFLVCFSLTAQCYITIALVISDSKKRYVMKNNCSRICISYISNAYNLEKDLYSCFSFGNKGCKRGFYSRDQIANTHSCYFIIFH